MKKTLLTIGAGPGIGLATAARFAREGYRVVLASRNTARLEQHAAQIADAATAGIEVAAVNARDPHSVARLVERYGDELGVLHYNAGVLHYGQDGALQMRELADESVDELISDMQVNVTSALAAIRSAADAMERHGGGTILLTGGGLGIEPSPKLLTLSVGKAALRAAGKALFEPLSSRGIHLATVTVSTLVSPGSQHAEAVGQAFWSLHAQPRDGWAWEVVYA